MGPYATEFNRLVSERTEKGASRQDAVIAVAKADPLLHAQYIAETNGREIPTKLPDNHRV